MHFDYYCEEFSDEEVARAQQRVAALITRLHSDFDDEEFRDRWLAKAVGLEEQLSSERPDCDGIVRAAKTIESMLDSVGGSAGSPASDSGSARNTSMIVAGRHSLETVRDEPKSLERVAGHDVALDRSATRTVAKREAGASNKTPVKSRKLAVGSTEAARKEGVEATEASASATEDATPAEPEPPKPGLVGRAKAFARRLFGS